MYRFFSISLEKTSRYCDLIFISRGVAAYTLSRHGVHTSSLLPIKYWPLLWIIVLEHVVQEKLCTGEVIYIQGVIKNIQ